jgi:hypothetical protein
METSAPTRAEQAEAFNREFQAFLASSEYQTALRAEEDNPAQDIAFLDVPIVVCGIQMRPLTMGDLSAFYHLLSPLCLPGFLNGTRQPISDVPELCDEEFAAKHVLITAALVQRRCRKLAYREACEAIRAFMNDAMAAKPVGSSRPGKSYASWIAHEVHFIAKFYGWSEADVLKLPLNRLFQYQRLALASDGNRAALTTPGETMRAQWLKQKRAELSAAKN